VWSSSSTAPSPSGLISTLTRLVGSPVKSHVTTRALGASQVSIVPVVSWPSPKSSR